MSTALSLPPDESRGQLLVLMSSSLSTATISPNDAGMRAYATIGIFGPAKTAARSRYLPTWCRVIMRSGRQTPTSHVRRAQTPG